MKVKLSYNDLTLILGLIDGEIEDLKTGITGMEEEIKGIEKEQETCWEGSMKDETAALRHEELRMAIRTDHGRLRELTDLARYLRETR
jgi:hypothetical protein